MHEDTRRFLMALREGCDGLWSHIWLIDGKRTIWFRDGDDWPRDPLPNANVYIGGALATEPGGIHERIKAQQAAGIVGFWADIDWADVVHQKTRLPDQATARRIIDALPLTPTYLIHSGHGYQCWWLFEEPWVFEDDYERERARKMAEGWMRVIQKQAAETGHEVDSTHDLSRVLRLPGTLNAKPGAEPVPVTILREDGRYNPGDFEIYLPAWEEIRPLDRITLTDTQISEQDIWKKLWTLAQAVPEVMPTFNHDLGRKDSSNSAIEMALANMAAAADWSNEEIAGLIRLHRIQYEGEGAVKAWRSDYLEQTIAKARASASEVRARITLMQISDNGKGEPSEKEREDILRSFSHEVGVTVTGITKFTSEPPTYRLEILLNGRPHSVSLGGSESLTSVAKFKQKLFEATDILCNPSPKTWNKAVTALMRNATLADTGEDMTEAGRIVDLVGVYLRQKAPRAGDLYDAYRSEAPFVHDGSLWMFQRAFHYWLKTDRGEKMAPEVLAGLLTHLGFTNEHLPFTDDRGRTSWGIVRRLPRDLFSAVHYQDNEEPF